MFTQISACLGGKVKFFKRYWNGYLIQLSHNKDELGLIPGISLIRILGITKSHLMWV
jgi:hypothetical protein